jgi:hypothetical protein
MPKENKAARQPETIKPTRFMCLSFHQFARHARPDDLW